MQYSLQICGENQTMRPRWPANHPSQIGQIDSCLVICNVVLGCVWATLRVMADPESAPSEFGPRNVRSGVDLSIRVELGRSFRVSYYCPSRCMVLCKGSICYLVQSTTVYIVCDLSIYVSLMTSRISSLVEFLH